ncbi:RHS repeat domain-containing protein, partial [Marinimicrobium locisalis]|uniref:RHS repeat domain-containing protein n=1 Tax=Marinimicrobium locisalis TaxID=546022 RepID=UPI0032215333
MFRALFVLCFISSSCLAYYDKSNAVPVKATATFECTYSGNTFTAKDGSARKRCINYNLPEAEECSRHPLKTYGQSSEVEFNGHDGFTHNFWYCGADGETITYKSSKFYNRVKAVNHSCPGSHPYGPENDHYFGPDKDRAWQRICYNPNDFCRAPFEWEEESSDCVLYCPPDAPLFDKELGVCIAEPQREPDSCERFVGNPINAQTGEKVQVFAPDLSIGDSAFPIEFSRIYQSIPSAYISRKTKAPSENKPDRAEWKRYEQPLNYEGPVNLVFDFGQKDFSKAGHHFFSHNYEKRIIRKSSWQVMYQDSLLPGTLVSSSAYPTKFSSGVIKEVADGWVVYNNEGVKEVYSSGGRLEKLEHPSGRWQKLEYGDGLLKKVYDDQNYYINFDYNNEGLLERVTLPSGSFVSYQYDSKNRMTNVTFSNGYSHTYGYNRGDHPYLLTSISDPYGHILSSWDYDLQGRAIKSEHSGSADATQVSYEDNTSYVTNSSGLTKSITFDSDEGYIKKVVGKSVSTGGEVSETSYTDGNPVIVTRDSGLTTKIDYYRGRPKFIREYFESNEIKEERYVWNEEFGTLESLTINGEYELKKSYGTTGRLESVVESVSGEARETTFTYGDQGLLKSVDGSRVYVDDIGYFHYDEDRRMTTMENALGHKVSVRGRGANGEVVRIKTPNGRNVDFEYDVMGRMTGLRVGEKEVNYKYSLDGLLTEVENGAYLFNYGYDEAGRLVSVSDAEGNSIEMTLDASGDVIEKSVYDSTGKLVRTKSFVYDEVDRLHKTISASGQVWENHYDISGNLIKTITPVSDDVESEYDVLGRRVAQTDQMEQETRYEYDGQSRLTKVVDATGKETLYTYNGFGELTERVSPDTGTTTYDYDSAGNRLSRQD